jgi:hypothetical protein
MIDHNKLNEIEAGLKGVTPGPWCAAICEHPYLDGSKAHIERHVIAAYDHPQLKAPVAITRLSIGVGLNGEPPVHMVSMTEPDHLHIARLDPATVRELVRLARIGLAAKQKVSEMTPEELKAMHVAQARSWVRGEIGISKAERSTTIEVIADLASDMFTQGYLAGIERAVKTAEEIAPSDTRLSGSLDAMYAMGAQASAEAIRALKKDMGQ